ncbi:MAG: urea transporter, partial [Nitrospinaceae bacterium]
MRKHLKSFSKNSSEIFFLNNPLAGVGILAVTLINPNVSIAGTIAVVSAYLCARVLKVQEQFLGSGFYTFNPLLVGFSVGYLFNLTFLTIFIVVSLGVLTYLLTSFLYNVFSFYLKLPILSLPFAIVSSSVYLASSKGSAPFVTGLYQQASSTFDGLIPLPVSGYFKALGAILFIPEVSAGFAFALIIFAISRILFFLTLLGYFTGTCAAGLIAGSFDQVHLGINHFNCILIAVAVGGVFLIPSPKSYILSMAAVVCSTLLMDSIQAFWSTLGIPVFTLPFNVVCLVFVYVLGVANYPLIARFIRSTPEETLDYYLAGQRTCAGNDRTVSLPFSGCWTVWQGFNGRWTHKGLWRHAYDFVITGANGKTFSGYGKQFEDYHAFGKPVLSPVRGWVVKTVRSLPDNPVGKPDKSNHWGNFVILRDPRGFFVELSHFAQDSLQVEEGDW